MKNKKLLLELNVTKNFQALLAVKRAFLSLKNHFSKNVKPRINKDMGIEYEINFKIDND